MQALPSVRLHALALLFLLANNAHAHGGQYRGPSSVGPSAANTAANTNTNQGANGTSSNGSSAGPSTPASGGSGASGAGLVRGQVAASSGARPRGVTLSEDLGRWEYWWEFGKDPYLRLREAIYRNRVDDDPLARGGRNRHMPRVERPKAADLRRVASDLSAALSSAHGRDTVSSCLIALAKIGSERAGFDVTAQFEPLLQRGDQELRETAALAFGIAGELLPKNVALLANLIADTPAGRKLSGGVEVNERTRAFAAYASGLLLHRSRDAKVSMQLLRPLQAVLAAPQKHGRNLTVAAIEACAQFPIDWQTRGARILRDDLYRTLVRYYDRNLGAGDELIQAHVPTALAQLVGTEPRYAAELVERFRIDLVLGQRGPSTNRIRKVNPHIAQSCALALGSLSEPWDDEDSLSDETGRQLVRAYREHRDQQTRSFCALGLARMGGARARAFLLDELSHANKAVEQPWLAVALGVLVERQRGGNQQNTFDEVDREIVERLLAAFQKARNPGAVSALAIALGLTGSAEARDVLRARLIDDQKRDQITGYVALALGLLRDSRAVADLQQLRRDSGRRPFVLLQSVRSLGLLSDATLVAELSDELKQPNQSLARLSATSQALGQIGDRRSLEPLQALLKDKDATPLGRAFAAVALGSICDKDDLPWNVRYATHVNYRASTETLTDGASGILDLL